MIKDSSESLRVSRFLQPLQAWLVVIFLIFGLCSTIFGFLNGSGETIFPWASLRDFFFFCVFICFSFLFFSRNKRFTKVGAFLVGLIFFAMVSGKLWALMVSLVFIISAVLLGFRIISTLNFRNESSQGVPAFLVGAGTYGVLIGFLAHLPVNYSGLYGVLLAVPLFVFSYDFRRALKYCQYLLCDQAPFSENRRLDALILTFGLLHFAYALMPELGYDALTLHLLVPSHLFSFHKWGFDPSLYAMALIPMLGDWIFSVGYMLAGEAGSRLINLTFTYVMAYQTYQVAKWLSGDEGSSKIAVIIFLTTPLVFTETNSLHVEAIWSSFIVAAAMLIFREVSVDEKKYAHNYLYLCALMLAFAANAKAITLIFIPILICFAAWSWRSILLSMRPRGFFISILILSLIGGIPYLVSFLISGNPVFPFFNAIFKSTFYPFSNFNNSLYNSGFNLDSIYRMTFHSENYLEATVGAPGFQWLILFPAAIIAAIFKKNSRSIFVALFVLVTAFLVFKSQSYLRYIFPIYVFLCAFTVSSLQMVRKSSNAAYFISKYSIWLVIVLNCLFFTAATWTYRGMPLKILFNDQYRDEFLLRRSPVRLAVEFINLINQKNLPVAFFSSETFGALLNAQALYPNWYNNRFSSEVDSINSGEDLGEVLAKYNSSYLIVDDSWSKKKIREIVFSNSIEIGRFDRISVRRLTDELRFGRELIKNSNLSTANDWVVSASATFQSGRVLVSAKAPIAQGVAVSGGRRYRNEVVAKCADQSTAGRVQVNWQDFKGNFISSEIRSFDCSVGFESQVQELVSPENATSAIVYGSSNSDEFIQISKISFR